MANAIKIIHAEHRRIAAVLQCLDSVIQDIDERAIEPDFELLHAILYYIGSFLFRYHHPKEDFYVFSVLCRRYPPAQKMIDQLLEEHRRGDQLIEQWRQALEVYEQGGASEYAEFRRAVTTYCKFERSHMEKEEGKILPLARQHLTAEDWAEIDAEFTDRMDPLFGHEPKQQFQKLFSRITSLAPQVRYGDFQEISSASRQDP